MNTRSDKRTPTLTPSMLALKGKHGTHLRGGHKFFITLVLLAFAICCNKSDNDWRPDAMRSSEEWMKMALESDHPNERRRGVVGLAESRAGTSDWALRVYDTVARSDTDSSVRCAALRAMEQIADSQSQPTAVAVLQSRGDATEGVVPAPATVRWSAARVLLAIAEKTGGESREGAQTASALVSAAKSEPDHRVRITILDTLGHYRDRSVPPALVDALEDEDFAIRRAAESSLVALTGVTHHYDADAWRSWLAKTSDPFAHAGQTPEGWADDSDKPKWDWLKLPGSG